MAWSEQDIAILIDLIGNIAMIDQWIFSGTVFSDKPMCTPALLVAYLKVGCFLGGLELQEPQAQDMMIPKMLLSLDDYETDVENLGVTPNEIGVPDPDSDMALDITNQFITDRRCSFLSTGTNFATQLREKGKLTEFYQAGWQWS